MKSAAGIMMRLTSLTYLRWRTAQVVIATHDSGNTSGRALEIQIQDFMMRASTMYHGMILLTDESGCLDGVYELR